MGSCLDCLPPEIIVSQTAHSTFVNLYALTFCYMRSGLTFRMKYSIFAHEGFNCSLPCMLRLRVEFDPSRLCRRPFAGCDSPPPIGLDRNGQVPGCFKGHLTSWPLTWQVRTQCWSRLKECQGHQNLREMNVNRMNGTCPEVAKVSIRSCNTSPSYFNVTLTACPSLHGAARRVMERQRPGVGHGLSGQRGRLGTQPELAFWQYDAI